MSSLAAVISNGASASQQVVRDMLAASPHRGRQQVVVTVGGAVLGVATRSEHDHASARVVDGTAIGFSGVLDNRRELALELGLGADTDVDGVLRGAWHAWSDRAPTR